MEEFGEFPQQETDRLILRQMTLDDVEFYFHHFNNDKVIEGCCFLGPKSLEAAKEELERYCIKPFKENRGIRWGIVRKGGSELIGTCGYYDWIKAVRRAEIGYDLDPAYWGQGIMTEALGAVLKYGFEKMGLNRIQAIIDSKNTRSLKLVPRLGFKKEGVFRERSYFNGQFRDDVCFSLLRKEWTKS
ncbi:GNAT family N-acetyltransferase [Candidatus Bathyarchaeota archaeon]|nr:GNAT family N-acetyltransferase [Candidatus Bathyarchaeota archaeon]